MGRNVTPEGRGLGWYPSLPDHRDLYFAAEAVQVPDHVDLESGMGPVLDQGQLGCHDEETEVLTVDGWTPWAEYDGECAAGTINPLTHRLEYQVPTAMHTYEYDGPLHYTTNQSLDFALTPNHRMWVRKWNQHERTLHEDFGFVEMGAIGWYSGLLSAPSGYSGVELDRLSLGKRDYSGDDFLALLALVISDGWVGGTANNHNTVSFCCFREDRYDMVARLAQRLGIGEVPGRKGVWRFTDAELAQWFRTHAYTEAQYRSPHKRVPHLVQESSARQIDHFLAFFGDQHRDKQTSARQFYSSSKAIIDDLQHLLLKLGKRSGVYERDPRDTVMRDGRKIEAVNCVADFTLTEWMSRGVSIDRNKQVEVENYSGPVFCATVPNGLLVTRRNNSVLISGNSCTANMSAAMYQYEQKKQGLKDFTLSRLATYYNTRVIEGTPNQDSGASIRDAVKSLNAPGVCPETDWPYDISKFTQKPPDSCYATGKVDHSTLYKRVRQSLGAIQACLAAGFPVGIGFTVYESFETDSVAKSGMMPMPSTREKVLGGHAVTVIGYRNDKQLFKVRNSWGSGWGGQGNFFMPYAYLLDSNLASDFWKVSLVSA